MEGLSRWRQLILAAAVAAMPVIANGATTLPRVTDTDVTFAVERAILFDSAVPANDIDAVTNDGIVTLSGTVDNILARERAVRIAESVKGVRSVVDRITVKAPSRPDDEIRKDVGNALLYDRATDSYQITPRVVNGVVTLSGTVDSWQEKQLALDVASGVRGVTGVVDGMNDAELEEDIEYELFWSPFVDSMAVKVDVDNGVAKLTGTVDNWRAFTAATQNAFEAGALVVVNDLEVQ